MDHHAEEMLRISRKLLGVAGLDPEKVRLSNMVVTFLSSCTMCTLVILGLIKEEHTFSNITDLLMTFFIVSRVAAQFLTVVFARRTLCKCISNMNQFWPLNNGNFSGKLRKDTLNFLSRGKNAFKMLLVLLCTTLVIILSIKYFRGNPALKYHLPTFLPKWFSKTFEDIFLLTAIPLAVGFDFMFATLLIHLSVQFHILRWSFTRISHGAANLEKLEQVVRKYVDHHNFLLEHLKDINKVFGPVLLLFLWNEVFTMVFMLYIITDNYTAWQVYLKQFFSVVLIAFELFTMFFLPCQYLNNEMDRIADCLYMSDWYLGPHRNSKNYLLMSLAKARQETCVSAGGLLPMNFATCTNIFRATMSTYTFLVHLNK